MSIVLIDDIAYLDTVSEKIILSYVKQYEEYEENDKRLPTITVKKLRGVDPTTLFPKTPELIKGGRLYIIQDGRHRLLSLKRLGHKTVKANIS